MAVPRTKINSDTPYLQDIGSGFVQTGRVNRSIVLPYQRVISRVPKNDLGHTTASNAGQSAFDAIPRGPIQAHLYDSYWSTARGTKRASMALTLASSRSSLTLIATRAKQLASAANSMRKGKVTEALHSLNYDGLSSRAYSRKSVGRDPARYWLEINFAWSPLISDIGQAINVLQSSPSHDRVSASSSGSYLESFKWTSGIYDASQDLSGTTSYLASAYVSDVNPNLLLANNLGFTNPAFVAWDAVPFSFVVDWFLPVGKFLNSFDASVGVTVTNGCITERGHGHGFTVMAAPPHLPHIESLSSIGEFRFLNRSPGSPSLPSFGDRVQPLSGSIWRAVTSVALAQSSLAALASNLKK